MNSAKVMQTITKQNTFEIDAKVFRISTTGAVSWLIAIALIFIAVVELKYKFRRKIGRQVKRYRDRRKARKSK